MAANKWRASEAERETRPNEKNILKKISVCLSTILSVSMVKLLLNAHIKLFCVCVSLFACLMLALFLFTCNGYRLLFDQSNIGFLFLLACTSTFHSFTLRAERKI